MFRIRIRKSRPETPLENRAPSDIIASHDELRIEVIKTREVLLKELKRLNKKFDLNQGKKYENF